MRTPVLTAVVACSNSAIEPALPNRFTGIDFDLVQLESHFDTDLDVHRMPIFDRRLETPLFHSFDRFGVETES